MAQQRQPGADRLPTRSNHHDSDPPAVRAHPRPARHRRAAKPLLLLRRLPLILSLALLLAASLLLLLLSPHREIERRPGEGGAKSESDAGSGSGLNRAAWPKTLRFGHGSLGAAGRDSRYWDKDDRRRDQEYTEEDENENERGGLKKNGRSRKEKEEKKSGGGGGVGGLYNEGGRAELDSYQEEYQASLKNGGEAGKENAGDEDGGMDEYDDGIDAEDEHDDGDDNGVSVDAGGEGGVSEPRKDVAEKNQKKGALVVPRRAGGNARKERGLAGGEAGKMSGSGRKPGLKRKPKRTSCEMKFLNSTRLVEPLESKKFSRFSLQYTDVEDRPSGLENWEPRFAGHQTLQEREESYYARDQKINCGFIKGPNGSPSTGFDVAEDDVKFMGSCHIAVASCIFGNSDNLRIPYNKMITRQSRKNVCFIMFVDENTLQTLLSEGQKMDSAGFVGLWKIVVVKNLPYTDMRRVGKIPKFLTHRLFPSARYSIWLDSKLRLQNDPLLILEYFLWRRGYEYSISNHYDRHCVWEEVAQNKKLNKFNHTIIDQQFEFYQADGLKRFDPSDPNKVLPSYVPEGSFIVRAHTPMSNLFSCLWFNEVDRFTPRDQLSFAYTYLKLKRMNPGKHFYLHMFKDCERRSIAKLFHHRGEGKRNILTKPMR